MRPWSYVLFFVCFNAACSIIALLVSLGVLVDITGTLNPSATTDVLTLFSLNNFTIEKVMSAGAVAGIAALFGLIFRQGIFAIYAVLLFVVGLFTPVILFLFNGVYNVTNSLFVDTPFYAPPGQIALIPGILQAITLAFFFFFLASILAQRQDLT